MNDSMRSRKSVKKPVNVADRGQEDSSDMIVEQYDNKKMYEPEGF